MRFASSLLVAILAVFAIQDAGHAQNFDKVEIKTVSAGKGVYMLTGAGGNIGVLTGPDGVALIDSQFGQLHQRIKDAIAEVGGGPVRYVLNTNWHYDHALGNEFFRKSGAVIVAQGNCRSRMDKEQVHEVLKAKTPAYPQTAWPEVTFSDSLNLHLNGETIEALHIAAAHSDADALYRFRKANVVHTGDLFCSAGYPYIDIGNGGRINGMIAAADRTLSMADGYSGPQISDQ
jgi:cyclase